MTTKNETIETVEEETIPLAERGILYKICTGIMGIFFFLVLLKIVGFILVTAFWAILALMA